MKLTRRLPTLLFCHWSRNSSFLKRHPCWSYSTRTLQQHASTTATTTSPRTATTSTIKSSTTEEITPAAASSVAVPRAAVSIVARYNNKYALIRRGKEPNKGIWSFPGGKIELGEQSLAAAKRELWEETGLSSEAGNMVEWSFQWCEHGPISTTDSIHMSEDDNLMDSDVISKFSYHYVISHWFVEIKEAASDADQSQWLIGGEETVRLPTLLASDDAMDAMWFDIADIKLGIEKGEVIPGIEKVLSRSELMYEKGLLL
mmetsp:Transcript_17117/g.32388  ORF Transcript_17117/g.32388 Transcript_17117/m.32388 type:complete len:259 (-) Transcript_17117:71-847(-)